MSLLSRLFGGGGGDKTAPAPADPVVYNGYRIFPEPMKDGAHWRIAARIEADVDGETRTHQLIRADTLNSEDAAKEASVAKARVMIDQQGHGIFR
ncbi:HlyU family transcriptional regulator [Jannaschia marina]|uniref:HlyU family transcriptional regulator n=1 Tax=Jannaschia marina TaxID=2741674 RepID=UPI0015C89F37|nr:HlyU family transcriptional regulator [Jannaschia marina]